MSMGCPSWLLFDQNIGRESKTSTNEPFKGGGTRAKLIGIIPIMASVPVCQFIMLEGLCAGFMPTAKAGQVIHIV